MTERSINPLGNLYNSFQKILKGVTIKYTGKANDYETMEIKMSADSYLSAVEKKDTYLSYSDYTITEIQQAGISDYTITRNILKGNLRDVPSVFHEPLLLIRRKRELLMYEEQNDYYRVLNGYPTLEDTDILYTPEYIAKEYGIDTSIPLHKIQDYYNDQSDGRGDYFINVLEGLGYIDDLRERFPEKKYLNYLGSNRISLVTARKAKNFQIIQMQASDTKDSLQSEFVRIYEQCREYFVKTIYVYNYRKFFERYDNFIALCIMVMTIQQLVMRQLSSYISRDFFDINGIRMLYEMYDLPFDLTIDEDTQNLLIRNLNMLIQNKATDKVIYDISNLLGFTNIKVYRYLLAKERKFDPYGVPIVEWTTRFNTDTGEVETVPDYKKMYDVYFQKFEILNDDFIKTFTNPANHSDYGDVTERDPFWIEDQNLYDRLWETSYNFVESKYLSLGVSYSMTEIMFENTLFLKLLLSKRNDINDIRLKLPRITGNTQIPLFDVIIALICLTSSKHNLFGEIISIPTQVISVVDYIRNVEHGDVNLDSLKFNYNYFFNPDAKDDNIEMEEFKDKLIDYINENKTGKTVETFQFNFKHFAIDSPHREERLDELRWILGPEDYKKFRKYVDIIYQDTSTAPDKIKAINDIYKNIKNLKILLSFYLTKNGENRYEYEKMKRLNDALFYSEEMSEIFEITGSMTGHKRTAFTYFEFLYHLNPKLYSALFEINYLDEYNKYLQKKHMKEKDYSYDEFMTDVELGNIFLDYSAFKGQKEAGEDVDIKTDQIYFYVNHIISRLQMIIDNIEFMYMMNDAETPLAELLLKLVRFFKSYTVDIIGMDTLFVCDAKPENSMKLFDEIYRMVKLIQIKEDMRLSYSDAIHSISSYFTIGEENSIRMRDHLMYDKTIFLGSIIDNAIKFRDSVEFKKLIQVNEYDLQKLDDCAHIIANINVNGGSTHLTDRVVKMWYSD